MFVNENGSSYIAATTRYATPVENPPKPQAHATVHAAKPAPANESGNPVVHLWHAAVAAAKTTASGFADGKDAAVDAFSQARNVIAEDVRKGDILRAVHDFHQGQWNIAKEAAPHVWGGITDANRNFNNSVDQTSAAALDGATGFVDRHFGEKAGNLVHDGGTFVGKTFTQHRDFNIGFVEGLVEGGASMVGGIEELCLGVESVRLAAYDYATKGHDHREGVNAKFANVVHNPEVISDGAGRAVKGLWGAAVNFGKDTWRAAESGDAEHFGKNTGRITFDVGSLFVAPEVAAGKAPKFFKVIDGAENAGKEAIAAPPSASRLLETERQKVPGPGVVPNPPVRTLVVGGGRSFRVPQEGEVFLNIDRGATPHILGDILKTPLAGGQFDRVYFEAIPYTVLVDQRALSEAFRLLKPGGEMTIVTGSTMLIDADTRIVALSRMHDLGFERIETFSTRSDIHQPVDPVDLTSPNVGWRAVITARKPG